MQPAGFGQIAYVDGRRVMAEGAEDALTILYDQSDDLQALAVGKSPVVSATFGMCGAGR